MDKWDEMSDRLTRAVLADEPGAILVATLQYFGEFGRALELLSSDSDRIAGALERIADQGTEKVTGEPGAAKKAS